MQNSSNEVSQEVTLTNQHLNFHKQNHNVNDDDSLHPINRVQNQSSQQINNNNEYSYRRSDIPFRFPKYRGYFGKIQQMYQNNKLFLWYEILSGNCLLECYDKLGLYFLRECITCNSFSRIILMFLSFATADCLPNRLRPFLAGFVIPFSFLLLINYKYVISIKMVVNQDETFLYYLYCYCIIFIIFTGCIGSGGLNTDQIREKSTLIIHKKHYLNNPNSLCNECGIIKCFRSVHCIYCKQCVPKFTRHSLFLNQCIGAKNQFCYTMMLMNMIVTFSSTLIVIISIQKKQYSMFLLVCFILFNAYFLCLSLIKCVKNFIFNLVYNCTEFEIKTWMHQPYLISHINRNFYNPFDLGFVNNVKQSIFTIINRRIMDQQQNNQLIEQENSIISPRIQIPDMNKNENKKVFFTNWNNTLYFHSSQIANHRYREEMLKEFRLMEEKLIQESKILQEIRLKINREYSGKISYQQINRKIAKEFQQWIQESTQKQLLKKQQQYLKSQKLINEQEHKLSLKPINQLIQKQQQHSFSQIGALKQTQSEQQNECAEQTI